MHHNRFGDRIAKWLAKIYYVIPPRIRYFPRRERSILRVTHGLFLVFAALFAILAVTHAFNLFTQTKNSLESEASITAYRTSIRLNSLIEQQYQDLKFLRSLLFSYSDGQFHPTHQLRSLFASFESSHPEIIAIDIENPSGNIVWSSMKDPYLPNAMADTFTAVPDHTQELIGTLTYIKSLHRWVIPLRLAVTDTNHHLWGYIGSTLMLSNFSQLSIPSQLNVIIWAPAHHQIISQWANGQWVSPTLSNSLNDSKFSIQKYTNVKISGLPWEIGVYWLPSQLYSNFWRTESDQILPLVSIMLLILIMDFAIQNLIRRLIRLRLYQQAIFAIQQKALPVTSQVQLFLETVDILSALTDGTFFYIQKGSHDDPHAEILAFNQNNRIAKEPCQKVPPIPLNKMSLLMPKEYQKKHRLSIKAFPIYDESPAMQLIVMSEEYLYFSKPICNMLTEMAYTLRNIVNHWNDINLLELTEEALAHEAKVRLDLINNIGVGIFLATFYRIILRTNDRVTEIFGYTEEELIGQSFRIIYSSDELFQQFGTYYHLFTDSEDGVIDKEYKFQRKDRTTFIGEMRGTLLDRKDPSKGIIWTIQDISEKIAMQNEIKLHNERMRNELELAASLQQAFLPHHLPKIDGITISWEYIPSSFLAGDMIDVIMLDDTHLAFYVLDVMGHGVSAALNAISINYLIRPSENVNERQRSLHPGNLFTYINEKFGDFLLTESYFTLFYGVLDLTTMVLTYARGGHPAPILMHHDGGITYLNEGDMPLGLMKEVQFDDFEVQLKPGDKLIIYSDGLTEVFNHEGEMFSTNGIARMMTKHKEVGIHQLTNEILSTVQDFSKSDQWTDDVTLLGLEWESKPSLVSKVSYPDYDN